MSILIFLLVSYILLSISLFFLFKKTDVDPAKGFIPGVNFIEWCKLIGRKPVHALWLLFPIVNIFIFTGMAVDLVRSFNKLKFFDTALAVIYAPAAFFKTAFNDTDKYIGPTLTLEKEYTDKMTQARKDNNDYELKKLIANNPYKKSQGREWVESIVFAVFAAAFIRMFLIEAYIIPTPSMEGSLLVGDFLFVSKMSYGIRTPQTIAMFPLLHNTIPGLKTESYLEKPSLPYYRLPKLGNVELNDPIVFNWPAGDSIYLTKSRSWSAYQASLPGTLQNDPSLANEIKKGNLRTRPVDKRDHYIKRCLGLPGDSLQIINRQVYINGKALENPTEMQFNYTAFDPSNTINRKTLNRIGLKNDEIKSYQQSNGYLHLLTMNNEEAKKVKESFPNININYTRADTTSTRIFPNDPKNFNTWTVDDFGPIYIPKAGETVVITPKNVALYRRIIDVYENHDFEIKKGRIYIDGEVATSYTFEQDYYWAMGDNRHASEDSRFWGFVPFDHMVGKPIFIWMSLNEGSLFKGIRWKRLFSSANKF